MTEEEAADIIFFEAESPYGFLARLNARTFDGAHWQQLWQAVAQLANYNGGMFDIWTTFDLARVIRAVKERGQWLSGRSSEDLDEFEQYVLAANQFINEVFIEF